MRTFTGFAIVTITLLGLAFVLGDAPQDVPQPPPTYDPPPTVDDPDPLPVPPIGSVHDGLEFEADGDTHALQLSTRLSHPKVPSASFRDLYAQVDVETGDELPEVRAPLNAALVIDRSGSMRGEPMAQARKAARTFVDALQPQDRVSLVVFDNISEVEVASTTVDEQGRQALHGAIDNLRAGGTTNISGGLRDGFQEVQRHSDPEMLDRVVLMTDGIPNVGITSEEGLAAKTGEIRRHGVTVTTLGFGTQYDADLMVAMAREGAGNFRHISNAADLELAFSDEIEDLQTTVASGVELEFRPAEGVEIENIYGFSTDDFDGGKRISLGELHTEDRRSVVTDLSVDESRVGETRELLDVRVRYVDRLADETVGQQVAATAEVVDSQQLVRQSINSQVMARVEEVRTQESVHEAIDLYASGNAEAAQQQLERERQRVQRKRREYDIDDDAKPAESVDSTLDRVGAMFRDAAPGSAGASDSVAAEAEESLSVTQGRK